MSTITVQQKLELFAQKTMESVDRQHREVTQEIQESIKAAVREAEESARREMKDKLRNEGYKLDRDAHKKIHAAAMEARRDLSALKERLSEALLSDLEKDLRNFAVAPEYGAFLMEGVAAVTVDEDNFPSIIQLMERDMTYKEAIEAKISSKYAYSVEATEEDFIGGFRLISADRRVTADYTLLTRLEDLYEDRSSFWH